MFRRILKEPLKNTAFEKGEIKGLEEGRAEGRREGEIKGKREGKIEIAKHLLHSGVDIEIIKKSTGLSEKELDELQKPWI